MQAKKLIEVAMPIREISVESVRDKSIRHGHLSTLHLWWARRPLPVCRAVVFASLVPDPLDSNCPTIFKDAIEFILGKDNNTGDPYKPYDDIPYTSAIDEMEDNLRNRLMMFIGKFSAKFILNEKNGRSTDAKDIMSDFSLIKWENKNSEEIITKARKLIFIAYNSINSNSFYELNDLFENLTLKIKKCEKELYDSLDRHINNNLNSLKLNLEAAINDFQKHMPVVFDPFSGGAAIPLEAVRLGCRTYGNDINPVAHIIQKGSVEFPQIYGKPITYSKNEFIKIYGDKEFEKHSKSNPLFEVVDAENIRISNRLSFDFSFFGNLLLKKTELKLQDIYPKDAKAKNLIAHYWVRVGHCINPSCKAEVPLLKQFYLVNKKGKETYLNPIIENKKISFEIKHGICKNEGWLQRGNLKCPVCGNTTEIKLLKDQFINGKTTERLVALIYDSPNGRVYKLPNNDDIDIVNKIPTELNRPIEKMPVEFTQSFSACTWGFSKWGDLFSNRQIVFLNTLVESLSEIKNIVAKTNDVNYQKAVLTYLGILIDRIAVANTSFGVWHTGGEKLERIMGRQALGMVFDYPESYPFCNSSGSAYNQMEWIVKYIDSESNIPFYANFKNASSGEIEQFDAKYITATITDPPYFDAIAYADLSDFFYVWLKRSLGGFYEENFSTPQTPKSDECTALKHHHGGDSNTAKDHFENKLLEIFRAIEHQTSDIVSIMFAHQSTEAWTTLCNSILNANMNITGSWAIDTEMTGALKTNKQFLSSSVTVSSKPIERKGIGEFKYIKQSIENTISEEVNLLYKLGFRGSDLLTACFGKAVSVFGEYRHVEKADGSLVTIKELLELTREIAFNSLLKGFVGDDYTKFYIGWLQLYGFTENDYNTAMRIVQIGLSINVNDLYKENILVLNQSKSSLASYVDRIELNKNLGEKNTSSLIDQAHKAMFYFKGTRHKLLDFISKNADNIDSNFWRVITALCEVLPVGSDDYQQAFGLLTNKESLIKECKETSKTTSEQGQLEF